MAPTHEPEQDLSFVRPRLDLAFDSLTVDERFLISLEIEVGRIYEDALERDFSPDEFRAAFRDGVYAVQIRRAHPGANGTQNWCAVHRAELDAIAATHQTQSFLVDDMARRVLLGSDLPKLMEQMLERPKAQVVLDDVRALVQRVGINDVVREEAS